jgi:hypothetical protein
MKARTCGTISPAHTPWRIRADSRTATFGARPTRSDASANPVVPRTKIARRPNRPAVIKVSANARV